jgi:hypothetical protein
VISNEQNGNLRFGTSDSSQEENNIRIIERSVKSACVRLSKLFFFFWRFRLLFQFGNSLPYPFYFSRVSFTQLWRSNGFPFLSHWKHSTFARTNVAFSFGLFFPARSACASRFIMFKFHIRSPLVQAQIPNIYRRLVTFLI